MTYPSDNHCTSNVQTLSDRQKLEDVIFDMSLFLEDNQDSEVLKWIDTLTSMDLYLDDETSSNCNNVIGHEIL